MKQESVVATFQTDDMILAAYILTKQALRFAKTVLNESGLHADFVFFDPAGKGPGLAREFASGGATPALNFYNSIRTKGRSTQIFLHEKFADLHAEKFPEDKEQ